MAIAFIPLRAGSKSIPLKNIKRFCGHPLSYWVISQLQQSPHISEIIIATDSVLIWDTLNAYKFDKLRHYSRNVLNAQDTSSTEDVILEYLNHAPVNSNELFILVQATNPFLLADDIDGAIRQMKATKVDSILSCVRIKRFFWNSDGTPKNYNYQKRPRRQDFAGDLMENGAFYISKAGEVLNSKNRISGRIGIYEMPEYSSYEIDEADDWVILENLFRRHYKPFAKVNTDIKLFLTDVDGVLTDAGMYYAESGDELKKFNTHDGMGFQLLREAGIKTGIITSEETEIVARRAKKLKVDYLFQGKRDGGKLSAALEICKLEDIDINNVAYVGDDINCYDLLNAVALKACPQNAVDKIKNIPDIIQLNKTGGDGAVREFVELILERDS
ncbi:MAG: hypothetical protein QM640_06595 [Niabella sp.]